MKKLAFICMLFCGCPDWMFGRTSDPQARRAEDLRKREQVIFGGLEIHYPDGGVLCYTVEGNDLVPCKENP